MSSVVNQSVQLPLEESHEMTAISRNVAWMSGIIEKRCDRKKKKWVESGLKKKALVGNNLITLRRFFNIYTDKKQTDVPYIWKRQKLTLLAFQHQPKPMLLMFEIGEKRRNRRYKPRRQSGRFNWAESGLKKKALVGNNLITLRRFFNIYTDKKQTDVPYIWKRQKLTLLAFQHQPKPMLLMFEIGENRRNRRYKPRRQKQPEAYDFLCSFRLKYSK